MVYVMDLDGSTTALTVTKLTSHDLKMPVATEPTAMAIHHPEPLITVILNGTIEFIELPTRYTHLLFAGYETFGVHRGHNLLPKLILPATTDGTETEEVLLCDDNYHLLGGGDTVRYDFQLGPVRDDTDVGSLHPSRVDLLLTHPFRTRSSPGSRYKRGTKDGGLCED